MSSLIAKGQGASPGSVEGPLAVSLDSAIRFAEEGTPPVLVRIEASAEDIDAIRVSAALVTTRGGLTGDGAIAARALGKPCITGVSGMRVNYTDRNVTVANESGDVVLGEGAMISIDAASGEITV